MINEKASNKTCIFSTFMITFFLILVLGISYLKKDNKEITSTTTVITEFSKTMKINQCPVDWTFYKDNCYKVYNSKMSFSQAAIYCRLKNKSAYLTDFSSNDEFEWIRNYVKNNAIGDVWVNSTAKSN